ncbi:oligosaccharide flippase family protein [Raoultella sp. Lac2]|uniref:oligosaccharide flippase family protein n=1 Tax=unclassified Raoultella TaxID=2627600 RepID=UPI001352B53B|nr:oligosaccharide flippase family protein [Raoultella sp. Lac2]MXF99527.1 oligosaccharide flippase family protein [Raoultella sp. Lac1]
MKNRSVINALWMMSEKLVTLFGLFFVTSFVAKYIGPYRFGQLALAIAIFQVVQVVAQMGCDNIIFKRVSQKTLSGIKLIYSTFFVRGCIYVTLSSLVLLYFFPKADSINLIFFASVCIACFFTSMDVFVIYNDATLNSKFNTIANVIGLVAGLVLRYIVAYFEMPIYYLALPIVLTTLIPFIIRLYYAPSIPLIKLHDKVRYNKYLIHTGIPLVISTVSMTIYSRINQFSLSYFKGSYDLGIYSVALTLGTAWVFIGNALAISFLSKIYAEKDDDVALNKASGLSACVFIVLLTFPFFFYFFGKSIIQILYGVKYLQAYNLLIILCISTVITSLGFVSNRYIVKMSGYRYLSKKTVIILIFSIPISTLMVYFFGMNGAAYSVLIIELLSLTIMNYFFRERVILKMHIGAFNLKNIKKMR